MNPTYTILLLLSIFFAGLSALLAVHLICYHRQAGHMLKELRLAEQSDTQILLTCIYPAGQIKTLVRVLNRVLENERNRREQLLRENRSYRESIISISHDIRTPLTSAKGYLQMLGHTQIPEAKKAEYAAIVLRRMDDLTGMLDQLFLYARLEAGEASLMPEELNAASLFADIIALFYEDFVRKGFEPEIQLPSKPCLILADRQAFTRIIENLLRNALLHGTGDCRLCLQQTGQAARIRISNQTGSILAEDIPHIFDRFYTTDTSGSRKMTGLGLAIVKKLAEQMDGSACASLQDGIFAIEVRIPLCAASSTGRLHPDKISGK